MVSLLVRIFGSRRYIPGATIAIVVPSWEVSLRRKSHSEHLGRVIPEPLDQANPETYIWTTRAIVNGNLSV